MASSGFLADFSRKPAGVKLGVFAVILVLLAAGWYQLFFSKVKKDIEAAKKQAQALNESKKKIEADEERYEELDKQQRRLKQLIAENDNALPTAAQLPAFFDMLNRKVAEAGVEVQGWEYQKEVPVEETIYKVPVQITMRGTFYQIERFFYLLYKVSQKEGDEGATAPPPDAPPSTDLAQERDRILTIEDLHLYEPAAENGELLVTATFRASTFRKEELPPPAEDEKDKKKKNKGKGKKDDSGGGNTDAGGGVLNKPTEAKQKVDDAMEKDEERARGADKVKGGM